jgi:hypothetical protein
MRLLLLLLLTQMPLASVQNLTVGQATAARCYMRSCCENAIGDRIVCGLLQNEQQWLKGEWFPLTFL